MKIAVLGAGAFGEALGGILSRRGFEVEYFDPKFSNNTLGSVLKGSSYIVLCVPSKAVPELLETIPENFRNIPLIIATKGLLGEKLFKDFKDYMVLSGPGFASDIKEGKRIRLTVTDSRVNDLFKSVFIDFDYTKDRQGVLLCGALKNVYAILSGYLELERETTEWKEFINDVVGEMKEILVLNFAEAKTVDLACGVGDLELTAGYPSRNYEFGREKRENPDYEAEKTVEGLSALGQIINGEIKISDDLPLLNQLILLAKNDWRFIPEYRGNAEEAKEE